ncbi:epithelial discoidin domain-containing receptor 1-like isoform X2 [Cuculus canorus]|uniref:epithelial discoidin domain-containing receptor 1-like isoform X2 n=1 Tax=Cuculus canorus TaxID=55661 RepID=UPI0023AAC034|nr:epithelial discoidin domain-containing receptor 1-like isoform X2 [Cuculus canorus]
MGVLPLLLLAVGTRAMDGRLDLGRCRFALGMEDGSIPDSRISASSAWSDSTAAHHGRLGRSDGDGAWCPAGPVFPEEEEFLEVDLGRLHLVTLVGTQGRHAGGHGREFAHGYRLRYSRDQRRWLRWRDRWGTEIIGGNEDPQGVVLKDLSPPVVARALRVYPRAPRAMSVCLRLELYGCPWDVGLLSYTAPRGQVMVLDTGPVVLNDSTYDGSSVGPRPFGGLGQLVDGVLGLDDFLRSRERRLWSGYDYVGWRRPPGPQPHVELEFEFEKLRRLHAMQVHCSVVPTRSVDAFTAVECRFKQSLARPWEEPSSTSHSPMGATAGARWVTVALGGRRARFLQCRFFFAAEWMLFSEVTFHSEVVAEAPRPSGGSPVAPPEASVGAAGIADDSAAAAALPPRATAAATAAATAERGAAAVLEGSLGALILLLVGIIVLILWGHRWKSALGKGRRRWEEELRVQLSVPGDTVVINNATAPSRGPPRYERIPPSPGGYREPTRPWATLPPAPPGPAPSDTAAYRLLLTTYARPRGGPTRQPPAGTKRLNTDGAYAEADVTGGSAYALAGPAPAPSPPLPAFPRGRLRFRQKLGEGQFGEVLLCEVQEPQALPPPSRPPALPPGRPLLVAVKVLRPNATKNARRDFLQEARTLGRLRDPNIVRLLGVCAGAGPLCIITEYMEHGDLHQFLGGPSGDNLSLRTLLHVGAQIASGMRFLSGLNFVHRDLATRNCLVGEGFTVKVADFGMSRHLYGSHYYRVRGRALLPIRWMAWECILMGTFTPASDAWAFGVTLWEVLTRCREQPYGRLSDEQVIANAGHHFRAQGRQEYLPCPPSCPPALHEVMLRCWARDADDRPTFGLLHRLLRHQAGLA